MRNTIPRVLWMKPKPQAGWGRLASQSSIVKMTYMPPILTGGAAPQDVAHVASLGGISEQLNTLEDLAAVRAHLVGLLSAYNLCGMCSLLNDFRYVSALLSCLSTTWQGHCERTADRAHRGGKMAYGTILSLLQCGTSRVHQVYQCLQNNRNGRFDLGQTYGN